MDKLIHKRIAEKATPFDTGKVRKPPRLLPANGSGIISH